MHRACCHPTRHSTCHRIRAHTTIISGSGVNTTTQYCNSKST